MRWRGEALQAERGREKQVHVREKEGKGDILA